MFGVKGVTLYVAFAGMLTTTLAIHDYKVHPDNKPCIQLPCITLQNIVDYIYMKSNITLVFPAGQYYHLSSDLKVQNITNLSFIGTPNTENPTSTVSIISCSQNHPIYFYKVVNLLIRNLKFVGCGSFISTVPAGVNNDQQNNWACLFLHHCTSIHIENVYIKSPVGYGIIGFNMLGNNSVDNTTVVMDDAHYSYDSSAANVCSHGILWVYNRDMQIDRTVFINITNIALLQYDNVCTNDRRMLVLWLHPFSVFVSVTNSNFTNLRGTIVRMYIASATHHRIYFSKCNFTRNTAVNIMDFQSISGFHKNAQSINRSEVSFSNVNFVQNMCTHDKAYCTILKFNTSSEKYLHIALSNISFHENELVLLHVYSKFSIKTPSTVIFTTGYFLVNNNKVKGSALVKITNGQICFNGTTNFTNNTCYESIRAANSMLNVSNTAIFDRNYCNQIITLHCKYRCYLVLTGTTSVSFTNNRIKYELIMVTIRYNDPYPYCIFQYFSPTNNDPFKDFKINVRFAKTNDIVKTINKLTSHCKWASGTAFKNIAPSNVTSQIIDLHFQDNTTYPLGTHTTVCHCPSSSHYNCSVDRLGFVYPGENLTANLCLPYNNIDTGLMYIETNREDLPKSACIIKSCSMKATFNYSQSKRLQFPIASEQQRCELFITAQPDLYRFYDIFYVQLLPCPLGFTLQNGICDCDPDLRKYIDECIISSQTVRRLPNVFIKAENNSNYAYVVSTSCPIAYCLHGPRRMNLIDTDSQCQYDRSDVLCSRCKEDYSMVFGSRRCAKCSNIHLLYIALILFTALILVLALFYLNLTVTLGTINGLILYVNIVQINSFSFHLQDRLVIPLHVYMSITNLQACFEMCFYNGMDMYSKKWLQLVYPVYLVIITILLVLGSRYSSTIYRLTFNRILPVLATLFVLSYTSMLQVLGSVFLYTTVTTLPSNTYKIVWVCDATLPLFGWKYSLLFVVSAVLFLLLLMFNLILIFTKPLMRFYIIHRFKPLIDAFQGSFKTQYYYWIGIQLLIRNFIVFFTLFSEDKRVLMSCIVVLTAAIVYSFLQPDNDKLNNLQEVLLLYNYVVMCVFLIFNGSETLNVIAVNVLVGLSFIQFLAVIVYHIFAFVNPCKKLASKIPKAWRKFDSAGKQLLRKKTDNDQLAAMEISEVGFVFAGFQEPLIGED